MRSRTICGGVKKAGHPSWRLCSLLENQENAECVFSVVFYPSCLPCCSSSCCWQIEMLAEGTRFKALHHVLMGRDGGTALSPSSLSSASLCWSPSPWMLSPCSHDSNVYFLLFLRASKPSELWLMWPPWVTWWLLAHLTVPFNQEPELFRLKSAQVISYLINNEHLLNTIKAWNAHHILYIFFFLWVMLVCLPWV